MFHAFADPLFHHTLVIEKAGAGEALDAGQHPGIDAQGDGDRLGGLAVAGHGRLHQPQVGPVLGPEIRLRLFAVEDRNVFPFGDCLHRAKLKTGWLD